MGEIRGLVYILCAATSLGGALLLLRGGLSGGGRLLLWASFWFFAMTLNNVLLYANFVLLPDVDLTLVARVATTLGIVVLNVGLIWHTT